VYKQIVSQDFRRLDEDVDDIDAVLQQLLAMKRLIEKLQLRSKSGKKWQQELAQGIEDILHDSSTEWLVENGRDLTAIREPF
jgi:hypothetical protein